MVSKLFSRKIQFSVLLVLILVGVLFASSRLGVLLLAYRARYVECDSKQLLSALERTFEISFPTQIQGLKTAKTAKHGIDSSISFIVKFTAKPETVNKFLESFPDGLAFDIHYNEEDDLRSAYVWPPPRWFTEPIAQGKMCEYRLAGPKLKIYIDTSDETNFVVYLRGYY